MATLGKFADDMRQLSVRMEANVNRKVRAISTNILKEVATKTPVDVGTAISNWNVGIGGAPDAGYVKAWAPGAKGSTDHENIQATIDAGVAALQDREPGQDVYITNDAPYIEQLNNGRSTQAPAGFVQTAIQTGLAQSAGIKVLD